MSLLSNFKCLPIVVLEVVAHLLHDFLPHVVDVVGGAFNPEHPEMGVELLGAHIELLHSNLIITIIFYECTGDFRSSYSSPTTRRASCMSVLGRGFPSFIVPEHRR